MPRSLVVLVERSGCFSIVALSTTMVVHIDISSNHTTNRGSIPPTQPSTRPTHRQPPLPPHPAPPHPLRLFFWSFFLVLFVVFLFSFLRSCCLLFSLSCSFPHHICSPFRIYLLCATYLLPSVLFLGSPFAFLL